MQEVTGYGFVGVMALVVAVRLAFRLKRRLDLSRAKAPNLTGHVRWSRRIAKWVPGYSYGEDRWFSVDGAPVEIQQRRQKALQDLGARLQSKTSHTLALTDRAEPMISDLQFTRRYRVPFQFQHLFLKHVPITAFWEKSQGNQLLDLDGNAYWDVTGSYGLNVFGTDFYQTCVDAGIAATKELGPVLGSYHPCVLENVERLCDISQMDEVSFHMSGTEAVMQAVRLARYHTKRDKVVRFSGAYHGWWDDMQPGPGNPSVPAANTLTLREGHANTLHVLRTRTDIACVLINPLQAMHANSAAPSDSTLVLADRKAQYDRATHTRWLQELRRVCTERGIALIFDEVFMGFRLGKRGAQGYFGITADMVTYGKTLGGGLPVGVICGKKEWMRRYRESRPADICFARGTFNAHPYVMGAMREFLRRLDSPTVESLYANAQRVWSARLANINATLRENLLPVHFVAMETVWTMVYSVPSRYNWMLQFYLREQGIALSWVGTGRFIFNLSYSDEEFEKVTQAVVRACERMREDGWWWTPSDASPKRIKRALMLELIGHRLVGNSQ